VSRRVLVTGATGFVGSHIARACAREGFPVRVTVRESSDPRWLKGLEVETVKADLATPHDLSHAVRDVDAVVHAAGLTRARGPEELQWVNVEATKRLAVAAAANGVERFIFISSLAARGPDPTRTSSGFLPDPAPANDYGRSKRAAEEALEIHRDRMNVVALRLSGVYGPRDSDLLPLFRMASHGWLATPAGDVRVQPIHAADAARAAVRALQSDPGFGPHPVAEDRSYSWPEVAALLEEAVGRSLRVIRAPAGLFTLAGALAEWVARLRDRRPALDRRKARDLARHSYTCDPGPTKRALEWRPEIPLPAGLRETARWYRDAGWLPS
jgi:nucleoside-diphosphate-sugar epimerase